jgi:hypothetical protein
VLTTTRQHLLDIPRVALGGPYQTSRHSTGGNTTVTNSYIDDNPWVGSWCDYGMYELFDMQDDCIIYSGSKQIQWENAASFEEGPVSAHRTTS